MDLGINKKVAIIGGSSKGLGKGCAVSLAKEGVNVVLCGRDASALEATAEEIGKMGVEVLPLSVDMSLQKDNEFIVEETIKRFGKIDIMVNNSGGPMPGTLFDLKEEEWEEAYNSVLKYVIRMTNLVSPIMRKNKWGRIINITSLSVKEPAPTLILSNVYRAGVVSLAKSISKELIKDNVTINNVCPGAFKTDRAIQLMRKSADDQGISVEEVENNSVKNLPLGRFQSPSELGDFVTFLASENARGISGTTVQIDGAISNGLL